MDMSHNQSSGRGGSRIGLMPVVIIGAIGVAISLFVGTTVPQMVLPVQGSEQAQNTDNLFSILLTLGTIVFVLVQGLLLYSVIAFRAKPNDTTDGPNIHGNVLLEIVWTIIPSLVVLVLAILSFIVWNTNIASNGEDNFINGETIQINATGQRYVWGFEYVTNEEDADGDVVTLNAPELYIYEGQDVLLDMSTPDVIHSFWMPSMRIKQDLLPGRTTQVRFTPIDAGIGYQYAAFEAPFTVYTEADTSSEVLVDMAAPVEGEAAEIMRYELTDPMTDPSGLVEVVVGLGTTGWIDASAIVGRYNRHRIICTELCGGGHGQMFGWANVYQSEEAMLASWYDPMVTAAQQPIGDPIELGETILASGQYPCAGCHVLESQGWAGVTGPSLTGIGDRADDRAGEAGAADGATYLIESLRIPDAYLVGGYGNQMPYFGPDDTPPPGVSNHNEMEQEDLIGIVAYLCAETVSGNPQDNTCGLEFNDDGTLVDSDAAFEYLAELSAPYEED